MTGPIGKGCLALLLAASLTGAARAEDAGPPEGEPKAEAKDTESAAETSETKKFVLGDHYELRVVRANDQETVSGRLIRITTRWLVLHSVTEQRNEQGAPASDFPGFNRLFKNVGIGRRDESIWVPRDAARIKARTLRDHDPQEKLPPGAAPLAYGTAVVRLADGDTLGKNGELEAVSDDGVIFKSTEQIEVKKPVPVVGQLPLVGGLFQRTEYEAREHRSRYRPADVLCIRVDNTVQVASDD